MRRITLNFIVDFVAFLNLLALAITGFIMKFVLPPGTGGRGREITGGRGAGEAKAFLSMTRHEWGDVHFYLSVLFIALMLLHIILHWTWIKNYIGKMFRPASAK